MDMRKLRENAALWRILEERAQALAQHSAAIVDERGDEVLTFQLGESAYGVAVELVREVQVLGSYTPLPGTPPFVLGLVNLRGQLLSALDLRPLLGLPRRAPRVGAVLLIVSVSGMQVGLLADEVLAIRRAGVNLSPGLALAEGQTASGVRGVDRDLTVLLDLAALLAGSLQGSVEGNAPQELTSLSFVADQAGDT
jgi:purine-binding chemotaxis protein CheW